jgi:hypothetical protein
MAQSPIPITNRAAEVRFPSLTWTASKRWNHSAWGAKPTAWKVSDPQKLLKLVYQGQYSSSALSTSPSLP